MKKLMQKVTGVALATLMAASSAGLGAFAAEDGADKIVNIGVTSWRSESPDDGSDRDQ